MEKINLFTIDSNEVDLRIRNFKFSIKMVSVLLIIFMVKFVFKYNYNENIFITLFATIYIVTLSSYFITKKITQNVAYALTAFYISTFLAIDILIFMSGGIRAPGILWLTLLPFFGTSLLGKKGFVLGAVFVIITFFILVVLNFFEYELYPFTSIESFQFEYRINIIAFTFTSFYFTYYHVLSENMYQKKLKKEKEKNENLLKILFHDLANPMQTIRLLMKKALSNRQQEELPNTLKMLDKTSIRIVEILDHVRKIKALEDDKIVLEMKPHLLTDCFFKIEDIFDTKLKEKDIKLNIKNMANDPTIILVDQIYFVHQVLGNLISNSIKFSDRDGEINVEWTKVGSQIYITIEDKGIGIPKDILPHVFEQEHRTSRIGTYGEVGTGYGMPLVKTFVEEFKGEIEIFSTEKSVNAKAHGTKVVITLPAV